jgi:hypothetical protein
MVEAATYHYRLLLPIDFPPGESEALYQRIRALKASGWNYTAAKSLGELPPNPVLELRRKQKSATESVPSVFTPDVGDKPRPAEYP